MPLPVSRPCDYTEWETGSRRLEISVCAIAGLLAAASFAATTPAAAQIVAPSQFDKPVSVRNLPPKSKDDPVVTTCTYFGDVMVSEIKDGPSSENAEIVQGANPRCQQNSPGAIKVVTEGMSLDGRKGKILFFSQMDPHGAVEFVLLNAQTGRIILRDGTTGSPGIQSISAAQDGLRLRYRRAINAPCSLMDNAARCWAQLAKEGKLPAGMEKNVPSGQICAQAYKKAGAPKDNPGIVIYQTEISFDDNGRATEISRGAVSCDSMP